MSEKIKVIAYSGIGKVFGLMAREAALEAAEREPELAENVCLAHLVTGKEAAEKKVKGCSCITIDGCPALCSAKSVEEAGGVVKAKFRSVDIMRKHRGKDAGTGSVLTEDGWRITGELAEMVTDEVRKMAEEEKENV